MKRVGRALLGALAILLAGTASAHAAPFVYVTNEASDDLSQLEAVGTGLGPLSPPGLAIGERPTAVAVTPDGRYAYVTHGIDGVLSAFAIGRTGGLAPIGTQPAGYKPKGIVVSPDGRNVYENNWQGGDVWEYAIGANGVPRRIGTPRAGSATRAIAIAPDGRYVYVARDGGAVTEFTVGEGGALHRTGEAPVCDQARGIVVTPDGRHVYVVCAERTISELAVGGGGHLSALGAVPAGENAWSIAVTPDSEHLYATALNEPRIREFDIGPGGRLHQSGEIGSQAWEYASLVAPDGRHLYVADNYGEGVSVFGIGPGGRLHREGWGPAGDRPSALAVTGQTPVTGHGRVGRDSDGRLEAFVLRDGELWDYRQAEPGGPFPDTPMRIGGQDLVGRPVVGATRDGRLVVVVVDGEHGHVHLAIQHRAGGDFGPVRSLGDPDPHDTATPSHPALATNANGLLEVFVTRHGEGLSALRQSHDGTFPDSWDDLGGTTRGGPAAATSRDGLIDVVTRDRDGQLLTWFQGQRNGHFIGPQRQLPPDRFSADPELIREDDGRLVVFGRHAGGGHVYTDAQRPAGERFASAWSDLGGPGGEGAPSAALNADGRLEVVARNRDDGLSAARQVGLGASFKAWSDLGGHSLGLLPAALGDVGGRIHLFVTTEHRPRLYVMRQLVADGDFEPHFAYVGEGG